MKKNTWISMMAAVAAMVFLTACGSDGDGGESPKTVKKASVSGHVEKGPFGPGSEVTLYELTSDLAQTGKSFRSQTSGYLGEFLFQTAMELQSQYVELATNGFYYNEVRGEYSTAPITLRALADVSDKSSVNVNLLTHLERGRVIKLLKEGKSFAAAKRQAERELMAVFAIEDEIAAPENISIADNNKNASILLAISTVMLHQRSDAEFSELLAEFSSEFAESGRIVKTSTREAIKLGQKEAHPSRVIEQMKAFYEERGVSLQVQDFAKFIDFNGDGVIDDEDGEEEDDVRPADPVYNETLDQNRVKQAVAAMCAQTALFASDVLGIETVRLDESVGTTAGMNLGNASDECIKRTWIDGYGAISQMNSLLYALDEMQERGADLQYYDPFIAQMRALRAFIYYHMAVLWGNIPFFTEPLSPDNMPAQRPKEDIFAFCIGELEKTDGIDKLGSIVGESDGFFSSGTVNSLLAEIGLWRGTNSPAANLEYGSRLYFDNVRVYDDHTTALLRQESGTTSPRRTAEYMANLWLEDAGQYLGVWAAIKRLGMAQELTGCSDHELLLPIPASELYANPNIRQNPGY